MSNGSTHFIYEDSCHKMLQWAHPRVHIGAFYVNSVLLPPHILQAQSIELISVLECSYYTKNLGRGTHSLIATLRLVVLVSWVSGLRVGSIRDREADHASHRGRQHRVLTHCIMTSI